MISDCGNKYKGEKDTNGAGTMLLSSGGANCRICWLSEGVDR